VLQVHPRGLELVAQAGAAGTGADRVVGSVHDVVGEQLRAAVEQLAQRLLALLGVEDVVLLDRHPGQLTPLLGDLARELRVLGLELRQLPARSLPFLPCSDLVSGHCVVLLSDVAGYDPSGSRNSSAPRGTLERGCTSGARQRPRRSLPDE